jgi:hypothetical protein
VVGLPHHRLGDETVGLSWQEPREVLHVPLYAQLLFGGQVPDPTAVEACLKVDCLRNSEKTESAGRLASSMLAGPDNAQFGTLISGANHSGPA